MVERDAAEVVFQKFGEIQRFLLLYVGAGGALYIRRHLVDRYPDSLDRRRTDDFDRRCFQCGRRIFGGASQPKGKGKYSGKCETCP